MKHIALALLLPIAGVAYAQTNDTKQTSSKNAGAANSVTSEDNKQEQRVRRAKARSLLVALSSDARAFHDQLLRARSLARIADALWQVDSEQGRLLFRKAWEAAEVADLESNKKLQEEIAQQKARTGGGFAVNLPPNIRREVLRLAARHERALGEEFLEKLRAQKVEAANSASSSFSQSDAVGQRLSLAKELLQAGDAERAMQFAGPALNLVSQHSIDFLVDLRDKNASAADAAYGSLLRSAASSPQSDANTVSLLSSYIFTPRLYITFTNNGVTSSQSSSTITPAAVTPDLREAFFGAAAAILLRPLPAPGQPDTTSSKLEGKYLVIRRLLPLFEQSAPAEMVESLRGHLNALNAVVSDNTRQGEDEWVTKGVKPDKPSADREQSIIDSIERARTAAERDSLYTQLAFLTAGRGEMRARDFVSKVEDSEIRKQLQVYIDSSLTSFFVERKQPDQALEMIHKGDLSQTLKAWALTAVAKIVAKTDNAKALELVDEAGIEARRLDVSDPNLPRALVAVANALNVIDPTRAWDATFDAVKAANSAEGFTGEDGELVLKFQSKAQSSVNTNDVPDFDLEGIFKELALRDYDRAVELARGFQGEGPRAVATIAIARAILEPKKKPN